MASMSLGFFLRIFRFVVIASFQFPERAWSIALRDRLLAIFNEYRLGESVVKGVWYNIRMSGHSKWSTIRRKKEVKDISRGKVFSKLSKAIFVAVRTGGGADVSSNYKLRVAIDAARAANMPKENIERAISKGSGAGEHIEEVVYEGFGPGKVGILVETATDNRNRTAQEMKGLFEKMGGSLGGPGSVIHNFESKGYILVEPVGDVDEDILALIDLGVEDVSSENGNMVVWVPAEDLNKFVGKIESIGFRVKETQLVKRPLAKISLSEKDEERLMKIVSSLREHDDVQRIFHNAQ